MKYIVWIGTSFLIASISGALIQALSIAVINLFSKENHEEIEKKSTIFFILGTFIGLASSLIIGARFVLLPEQIEKIIHIGLMIITGAGFILVFNILGRIFEIAWGVVKLIIKIGIVIFIAALLASVMFGL